LLNPVQAAAGIGSATGEMTIWDRRVTSPTTGTDEKERES